MSINKTVYYTFLATLLTATTLSAAKPPQPTKCPSAISIRQGGLKKVVHYLSNEYYALQLSNYDTRDDWSFVTMNFVAETPQQAFAIIMDELSTVTGTPTPNYDQIHNAWLCSYSMKKEYWGIAYFPAIRS